MKIRILATVALAVLLAPLSALAQPAGSGAGVGSPNDSAWSGSGSGSLISLDKYVAAKVEATRAQLVSGTTAVSCAACASAANQTTGNSSLSTIATNTTGAATAANQASANTKLDTLHTDLTSATPAGEAHLGEVGGNIVTLTGAPTVTASSAYSSGNTVGGLLTFSNVARISAGTGLIQAVTINFKSAQTASTDFVFCHANPTGTTVTDKSAVALAVADFDKCRAVHVSDCTNLGTPSVCSADNLALPFALSSGTTGYGFLVTRGTPTFTATTDVSVSLRILRN